MFKYAAQSKRVCAGNGSKERCCRMKIDVSKLSYEDFEKIANSARIEVVNVARVGKRIVAECTQPMPIALTLPAIVF
ncbi:hypothetical protein AUJ65_03545 [Candidatus Micrarchaeota archaeon CG1_02_51_15]|nr:MAG: hypothetical protein AUJ65_03545 [Candidatus Micrarchaeota archaeon CG1_02_51_15]